MIYDSESSNSVEVVKLPMIKGNEIEEEVGQQASTMAPIEEEDDCDTRRTMDSSSRFREGFSQCQF